MIRTKPKVLVTGGAGFVGSEFVRQSVGMNYEVVVADNLTYAGDLRRLNDVEGKYAFRKVDICDKPRMKQVFESERPEVVVHFAAESHVDRSILDAQPFVLTNILGTQTLLDLARESGVERFVHISTDEVYGQLGEEGEFREDTPLNPSSPYSASKASADLLVMAYYRTYDLPVLIVRPSNNYGRYQYPEKFIPLTITNCLEKKPVPIYGKGQNVRDWLYVGDCCQAIDAIMRNGNVGEAYNVGGQSEFSNIDVAKMVIKALGITEDKIEFVPDRPGHDFRYALDIAKIRKEIGWEPSVSFEDGTGETVTWYRQNKWWWQLFTQRLEKESKGFWS